MNQPQRSCTAVHYITEWIRTSDSHGSNQIKRRGLHRQLSAAIQTWAQKDEQNTSLERTYLSNPTRVL